MREVTLTAKAIVPNKVADILEEWANDPTNQFDFAHTVVVDGHDHHAVRAPFKVKVKDTDE